MPAIEWVACYYANRSETSKDPAARVTIETAREMVEAGQAIWSKGCKFLKLTKTEAEMPRADRSLVMGPQIIQLNAEGDTAVMELVAAWRPYLVPSVYQEAA